MNKETQKYLAIAGIVLGVIVSVWLVFWLMGLGVRSGAINRQEAVYASKSNIQSQEKRRQDLIPNIVATVKAGADNEHRIQLDAIKERVKGTPATKEQTATSVQIAAVAEAYPQITSTALYKDQMTELSTTENLIFNYREAYNANVRHYNSYVRSPFNRLFLGDTETMEFLDYEGYENAPVVK